MTNGEIHTVRCLDNGAIYSGKVDRIWQHVDQFGYPVYVYSLRLELADKHWISLYEVQKV